jgi:hypothetical protein
MNGESKNFEIDFILPTAAEIAAAKLEDKTGVRPKNRKELLIEKIEELRRTVEAHEDCFTCLEPCCNDAGDCSHEFHWEEIINEIKAL